KERIEYLLANSVEDEEQVDQSLYLIEFLNILILRLVNSTRLIVKECYHYLIEAKILTGINQGSRVFIPRIRLSPSDTDLPFQFVRKQFLIKLSFVMPINKAQ
ncbi:7344_t:CDS:2, partial [Scutellospora calospora]